MWVARLCVGLWYVGEGIGVGSEAVCGVRVGEGIGVGSEAVCVVMVGEGPLPLGFSDDGSRLFTQAHNWHQASAITSTYGFSTTFDVTNHMKRVQGCCEVHCH